MKYPCSKKGLIFPGTGPISPRLSHPIPVQQTGGGTLSSKFSYA